MMAYLADVSPSVIQMLNVLSLHLTLVNVGSHSHDPVHEIFHSMRVTILVQRFYIFKGAVLLFKFLMLVENSNGIMYFVLNGTNYEQQCTCWLFSP
jgi:hypothetical protein